MTVPEYNRSVDEYADGIYRFILKNTGNEDHARDVVQESFARLWEKRKQVSSGKAKTYLFTTAYHLMIDALRREKITADYSQKYENRFSVDNDYSDLQEILHDALQKLPEIQRTVVLLRDYEGYAYTEIGRITNLSESQVKVYIYRARMSLRKYIGSPDRVI